MHSNWKKNTALFLTSQTISLFGSSLVQYAILWYITLNTQSGLMMTLSIICGFVPTFLLSPFAGVWADRYSRKLLIILSDSCIAAATLILALLFLIGYNEMWLLFVVSAVRALGAAVQTPAVGAMLPQIVPTEQLTKLNGINGSIQALIMLLSPMLSGALLTVASIEVIFFIDVITAVLAVATMLLFVKVPLHAKAVAKQNLSYFSDMRLGIRYITQHHYIRTFLIFMAFFLLLAAPVAFLTPLQVTRTFGGDIWRLTAIEITFSIGMMIGGGILAGWKGFRNRVYTMTMSALAMGAFTFALGFIPVFWIYLLFMGLFGLAMPFFSTPGTVLLQERVEPDYMGRVFGVLGMISSSMMPFGMLIFGPLADAVKIEWMLMLTGLLMFILGLFLLGSKALVKAGEPAPAAIETDDRQYTPQQTAGL